MAKWTSLPGGEFWVRPIKGAGGDGGVWLGGGAEDDPAGGGGGGWSGYGLDAETGAGGSGGGGGGGGGGNNQSNNSNNNSNFAGGGDGADDGAFGRGDGGEGEWHRGFQVSLEALPPGVELPAAEATLFVGRAVRVLSQPRGDFRRGRRPLTPHVFNPPSLDTVFKYLTTNVYP